jgi:hypothetical protein
VISKLMNNDSNGDSDDDDDDGVYNYHHYNHRVNGGFRKCIEPSLKIGETSSEICKM